MRTILTKNNLLIMLILLAGCAANKSLTAQDNYIGTVHLKYAKIQYRAEAKEFLIAFQNSTFYPMKNLLLDIKQETHSGPVNIQYNIGTLAPGMYYNISVPVPYNSTGKMELTYYFRSSDIFSGNDVFEEENTEIQIGL